MKKPSIKTIVFMEITMIVIIIIAIIALLIYSKQNKEKPEESSPVFEMDLTTEEYTPPVLEPAELPTEVEIPETETEEAEVAENEVADDIPDFFKAQLITAANDPALWEPVNTATEDFENKLEVKNVYAFMDGDTMRGYIYFKNSNASCIAVGSKDDINSGILIDVPYGIYGQNYDALIIWDCDTPWFDKEIEDALFEKGYFEYKFDGHYDPETGDIFLNNIDPESESIQFNEEDFK